MTKQRLVGIGCGVLLAGGVQSQFVEQTDLVTFTSGLTDFSIEPFDLPDTAFDDAPLDFEGFGVSFQSGDFSSAGAQILDSRLRLFGNDADGDFPVPMFMLEFDRPVVALGAHMFGPLGGSGVLITTDMNSDFFGVDGFGISGDEPPFLSFQEGAFYVLRFSTPVSRLFIRNGGSLVFGITLDDVALAFETCTPDTNGDGLLTPADFNAWIIAFNNQSPACDQNGDGLCTPADFNAWIANFNTGCP